MSEHVLYQYLLAFIFIIAVIVFISLYITSAPYGRHERKGWGPVINARAGWIIMESPAVFVIALCFILGNRHTDIVSIIFLLMWELHYIQRTYVFPFLMRGGNKKFPLLLILFAIIFNTINGYLNGRYLFNFSEIYHLSWLADPRFITGALIFFTGLIINIHSDHILRTLRKPGESGYKIPKKGFFKYVSSPNYFGEILEWTGWAIATWSLAGLSFMVFTIANLMPRAHSNHKWYRETFPDYPKERKVLIPFIY